MRGKPAKDLTGRVFGRLTVLGLADRNKYSTLRWKCQCYCGNVLDVRTYSLNKGLTTSCGCSRGFDISIYTVGDVGIYLINGGKSGYFWFDAEDIDFVQSRRWHLDYKGYAVVTGPKGDGVFFARMILGVTDREKIVDHINGDVSDNRKCNLRVCSHAENMKHFTTNPVGVYKRDGKYRAKIQCDKKQFHLGVFDTFEEARKVREDKEKELFGEFAPNPKTIFFPGRTG